MLNIGFGKVGIGSATNYTTTQTQTYHKEAPSNANPVAKYATPSPSASAHYASGSVGVQCGAFSSYNSAQNQSQKVYTATGFNPEIQQNETGLYRVRINGLIESAAQNVRHEKHKRG